MVQNKEIKIEIKTCKSLESTPHNMCTQNTYLYSKNTTTIR